MPLTTEERRSRGRAYAKRWREKNPQKAKAASDRFRNKNRDIINKNRNERVLRRQEAEAGRHRPSLCEVCGGEGVITFDHCHQRGVFRGWICNDCNVILGYAKDDPNRLRKLIAYLERTSDYINRQLELAV